MECCNSLTISSSSFQTDLSNHGGFVPSKMNRKSTRLVSEIPVVLFLKNVMEHPVETSSLQSLAVDRKDIVAIHTYHCGTIASVTTNNGLWRRLVPSVPIHLPNSIAIKEELLLMDQLSRRQRLPKDQTCQHQHLQLERQHSLQWPHQQHLPRLEDPLPVQ